MKDRFEVLYFQRFHKEINTQFICSLKKILRSDNALEYVQNALKDYYISHCIIHQISCARTPQQNGFERKNCHLLDIA